MAIFIKIIKSCFSSKWPREGEGPLPLYKIMFFIKKENDIYDYIHDHDMNPGHNLRSQGGAQGMNI